MNEDSFMVNPQLDGDDFYWKGNKIGILLIHGFTATTASVRLIADKLHDDGYTVAAPLLPGHGTNPDDLNRVKWQMWLEKVKAFYEQLARECERTFVIGQSMGALLALELAAQHPEINGLMLFAPAIKIQGLWLTRFLVPLKKSIKKPNKDDGLPWKGYNVYPVKAAVELLKLQKDTKKQLSKITQPTSIYTAEFDSHFPPQAINIIINDINSKVKDHIHIKNSPHVILLGNKLDQVYARIHKFIQEYS